MFLDNLILLSDAQPFTGAATVSTNNYDCGATTPKREIGSGAPIGVGVTVDVAAGAGSTVLLEIIQSTVAAMTSPDVIGSFTDVAANFPVGRELFIALPAGYPTKQFIALRETSTGGTTTITLTAELTLASMLSMTPPKAYAKNYVT